MEKIETGKTETNQARIKKKNRKIALIVFLVLFGIGFVRSFTDFVLGIGTKFITYRDFESLELLDEFAVETDLPEDPGLKDLVPLKSYSKKIEYDGKWFIIRAYEFSNFEEIAKYFKAYGYAKPEKDSFGRGSSGGPFGVEYTTLEDGKILHIDSKYYRNIKVLTNFLLEKYPEEFAKLRRSVPANAPSESPMAYYDGVAKQMLNCKAWSQSSRKFA